MLGCSLAVKVLPGLCEDLGSITNIKRKEGRREGWRKGGRKGNHRGQRKWLRFDSKRAISAENSAEISFRNVLATVVLL